MGFDRFASWKLEDGLWLEAQKGGATYRARASVNGIKGYVPTGQKDRTKAESVARKWFRQFRHDAAEAPVYTMADAAQKHIDQYEPHRTSAREDFRARWTTIKDVCDVARMDVRDITTAWIRGTFQPARSHVSSSTAKKDLVTIRQCLKVAREQEWIDSLPEIPKSHVTKNPRRPYRPDEWETIKSHLKAKADTGNQIAADLYDFCCMEVLGLFRPEEIIRIQIHDVVEENRILKIYVTRKTGIKLAGVPIRYAILDEIVRRRLARAKVDGQPRLHAHHEGWVSTHFNDLVLSELPHLRIGPGGSMRNSWSLRSTGICMEITRQRRTKGTADLLQIARWAGTSVARIDQHYAVFLDEDAAWSSIPAGMGGAFGHMNDAPQLL